MRINIACLQMASKPYDWDYNINKTTSMIREAAENGAEICLLPEVFIPGYSLSYKNFKHAESMDGKTINKILDLAKELNIYISGSIIEKLNEDFYNTMFLLGPQGILGTYHKKYVFGFEQKYWKRGNESTFINSKFGTIGLGICADMHYSDLWKQYSEKINLILICSAWVDTSHIKLSYAKHEFELCKTLPVKISKVLQVPTAYCNAAHECTGFYSFMGTTKCGGFSKIIQNGEIIASLDSGEEGIIHGKVDISKNFPVVDPSEFDNWIKYSLKEIIPKFVVEDIAGFLGRISYRKNKKKYL
ncbi:MAG: carbon-nitrogen hydrolase family protein [Candidatus Helarchaeota archaeon]